MCYVEKPSLDFNGQSFGSSYGNSFNNDFNMKKNDLFKPIETLKPYYKTISYDPIFKPIEQNKLNDDYLKFAPKPQKFEYKPIVNGILNWYSFGTRNWYSFSVNFALHSITVTSHNYRFSMMK